MKKLIATVIAWMLASTAAAQSLEDVVWVTEEYPPYNFSEDGVPGGLAVDLLVEIWKKAGLNKTTKDIAVWPWNRGVHAIKTQAGTCLFSTSLTPERANVLGWKFVYPIPQISDESNNVLIARKGSTARFESIDDLKNYGKKFGVVHKDIGGDLLREAGVDPSKLDSAHNPNLLVKKLARGRTDVISYGFSTAVAKMKQEGLDPDDFEVVYTFPRKPMGYAFHRDTDAALLKKLQEALDQLHADGTAEAIRRRYVE